MRSRIVMTAMAGILVVAVTASTTLAAGEANSAASVAGGYKAPIVTIPYAWHKPKIDGIIDEAEWAGAARLNGLQTVNHQVSPRQTTFWAMWDEDNIYIAMRSPFRQGERPIQAYRNRSKEVNIVFDDSYEIWIDVGSASPDGQPVFFQYGGNVAGVRTDVMQEPAVGNTRPGWTSGWQPANRVTADGIAWEMELAIPHKTIYQDKAYSEGQKLTCLLARNFKRPWEQNSIEGTGSFAVRDTHSRFVLSKAAPAVELLGVGDADANAFGLDLAVRGTTGEGKVKWSFLSDSGVTKNGVLAYKKDETATVHPGLGLDQPGDGSYRIRVTSEDGNTIYLDWCALRAFGFEQVEKQVKENGKKKTITVPVNQAATAINDKGDAVSLALQFNPVRDYLRVTGDFINFDDRVKIDHCEVVVVLDPNAAAGHADGPGATKELARQTLKIDELAYVKGVIRIRDVPRGRYRATMTCYDKAGTALRTDSASFEKKDPNSFPWWNTTAGNCEKVLAPWTAVKARDNTAEVWGRTMKLGPAGLPSSIVSAGHEMLAGPAVLEADIPAGTVCATGAVSDAAWTSRKDFRCEANVSSRLGDLIDVFSRVTVEYDGMYKVELTLGPRSATNLNALRMVVPLTAETAQYIYGKAEGIREGFDMRFVPRDGNGVIWDCRKVETTAMVAGSFIPYVWVGNAQRGLCWFADSDEGWIPDANKPAIELVRKPDGSCNLVFNLVSSPAKIDQPRTIVFAFQASPVRPMAKGWRSNDWSCCDTFNNYAYPHNEENLIWSSLPFTTDPNSCRTMVADRHKEVMTLYPKGPEHHSYAVPYFEYNTMGPAPEQAYFGEEWKTEGEPLWYGKTLRDFIIYSLDKWIKDCGIDGWYLDNVRPCCSDNIDAGRGYRLPDGRIQPTFNLFEMREFFLRLRAIWQENGKDSIIVNHMTNNMILPWNGAVDVAYDGEHNVIYPEMGKDFMDFWSLERLRMDYSGQWGVPVNFMNEYQGEWDPIRKAKVMRSYFGEVMLHDALPTGNSYADDQTRKLLAVRDRFGIAEDDVKFLPYWDANSGLSTASKDVRLAAWVRPGKILLEVVNFGEKADPVVQIDSARLGLPTGWTARDAEEGVKLTDYKGQGKTRQEFTVWDAADQGAIKQDGGTIIVPVDRHDFRLILIEKK